MQFKNRSPRNRLNTHILATSVLALAVGLPPARAALVTESLTSLVSGGTFDGAVGLGSFSYDDSLLAGVGDEFINAANGLTVEFTIFGQTFTEANDIDFDVFPELAFADGVPVVLEFLVGEPALTGYLGGTNPTEITEPGVLGLVFGDLVPEASGAYGADITVVEVVPEPAGIACVAALGLVAFAFCRRRFGGVGSFEARAAGIASHDSV